jgi:hypothetical protein
MTFPPELKRFVDMQEWRFARTYARTWPHEYLVRPEMNAAMFVRLVRHIRTYGYDGSFCSRDMRYYDEDGRVYWTMGAPIHSTEVVNRCLKEQSYEYRLEHRLLPTVGDSGAKNAE